MVRKDDRARADTERSGDAVEAVRQVRKPGQRGGWPGTWGGQDWKRVIASATARSVNLTIVIETGGIHKMKPAAPLNP